MSVRGYILLYPLTDISYRLGRTLSWAAARIPTPHPLPPPWLPTHLPLVLSFSFSPQRHDGIQVNSTSRESWAGYLRCRWWLDAAGLSSPGAKGLHWFECSKHIGKELYGRVGVAQGWIHNTYFNRGREWQRSLALLDRQMPVSIKDRHRANGPARSCEKANAPAALALQHDEILTSK